MNEITNVIVRTILVLVLIFILFKLMGKKQISQMNLFDYIIGITIGSIAADISLDIEKNLIAGIVLFLNIYKYKPVYALVTSIYPVWLSLATSLNLALWVLN